MSLEIGDIKKYMEEWAAIDLAEDWDNPGLCIGHPNQNVTKILVSLDAEEKVIDEAIEMGAELIVTHHPFIFGSIKKIDGSTPMGRKIFKLIKNNIGVYSAHTNLDVAKGGTNDVLAELAGLKDVEILETTQEESWYKLAVYVPDGYVGKVRDALFEADAGHIGNYSCCSFVSEGKGTFLPLDGTKPFIGNVGEVEKVKEYKLETVVKQKNISKTIEIIKKVHPYEEVAYDTYILNQKGGAEGIGRIGVLEKEMTFGEFAKGLKKSLGLKSMRIVGDENKIVKKVGLCTGAGMSFMNIAKAKGADVYISGDIKYHEAQNAEDLGICLIDATHYAGENIIVPVIKDYLCNKIKEVGKNCQVVISETDGQPFKDI